MKFRNSVVLLILVLGILVLSSCTDQLINGQIECSPYETLTVCPTCPPVSYQDGVPLPFETIEREKQSREGVYFEGKHPSFLIITNSIISDEYDDVFNSEAFAVIDDIDFSEEIAIAVFQGYKSTYNFEITIAFIMLDGNSIKIFANVIEPLPDEEQAAAISSPYHLVKIKKNLFLNQEINFELIIHDQIVYQDTLLID